MKNSIKTQSGNDVSLVGLGTMPISAFYYPQPKKEEAVLFVRRAVELGYNLIDTAMVYGNGQNGDSENIIGEAIAHFARENLFISTKCGLSFENGSVVLGGREDHIFSDCENSLKRLNTDYIDLLFLHRIDPNTPLRESITALAKLKKDKKVRFIGLSEVNSAEIQQAVAILADFEEKLDFIQNEYSVISRQDEENGVLELCKKYGISYMAYSPVGRGLLSTPNDFKNKLDTLSKEDFRRFLPRYSNSENTKHNQAMISRLQKIAEKNKANISQVALAWLLYQARKNDITILPIPGTKQEKYLIENYAAKSIMLSEEDVELINQVASGIIGERWPDSVAKYGQREWKSNVENGLGRDGLFPKPVTPTVNRTSKVDNHASKI